MRGRAGQGEGSSLPAHPGSDWDRNFTMLTFGPGTMAQVVMGRLYHGWVLLSIWAWGVIGPGAQLGEGRGRDGQGEEPILSLLQGSTHCRLPWKGWTVGLSPSSPWWPY